MPARSSSRSCNTGWLNYRQVLTSEGLTLFVNDSYSRSKPGTEVLQLLEYQTRGDLFEAGVSYPFIRQRESNLIGTALFFASNDRSDILDALNTLDRLRGVRVKLDADAADPWRGINQLNLVLSQGIEGLGAAEAGSPNLSRANGRADFTKFEATFSRLQPLAGRLLGPGRRLRPVGQHPPAGARTVRLWRARLRARLRPLGAGRRQCLLLLGELRFDVPHSLQNVTQFSSMASPTAAGSIILPQLP